MSNIINIDDKLEEKKRKEQVEYYQEKIDSILRTVQCSSCHLKCAMCGYHIDDLECGCSQSEYFHDFILCEECRDEFEDYLDSSRVQGSREFMWHNDEWKKLWASWLQFQKAIKEFRNSAEFRQLMEEVEDY